MGEAFTASPIFVRRKVFDSNTFHGLEDKDVRDKTGISKKS